MAIVLSGSTNDITVNGVSVATDTEVSSAVAPKANTTDLKEIGVGQTWQDVTASRANNTTYTNSTGKPIMVLVVLSADYPQAYVNGLKITQISSGVRNVIFIVPNGQNYKIVFSTGSIASWAELR